MNTGRFISKNILTQLAFIGGLSGSGVRWGLGSGKGSQDPQGLHICFRRDKTPDYAILGSIVWKRFHFLKASLVENHSQGGQLISQTPMVHPPQPKCNREPPGLFPSQRFLTRYSVTFQGQQKKTTSHAANQVQRRKFCP